MILVMDFGSQVAHLIARRFRDLGYYSELIPHNISPENIIQKSPCAIVLSGGPKSVYETKIPMPSQKLFELGIPILGICYGHQLITHLLGGKVDKGSGEYGKTKIQVNDKSGLLLHLDSEEDVWMSHSDYVEKAPERFEITSYSSNRYISSLENHSKKIYGVQFHPEVTHTPKGEYIFKNFVKLAGCPKNWSLEDFIEITITEIKNEIGKANVLMAVSGGIDSSVAAELIHRAIGNNLFCVFVNNGLLRKGEWEEVCSYYEKLYENFFSVDASDLFLSRLIKIIDPEEKRKIIGKTFIEVFENKGNELGKFDYLGQGTIYPDRVESAQTSSQASLIKSHHNVAGLPAVMKLTLVEPLAALYKDEVRKVGKILGLKTKLLKRHPFPGPGLAIRIIGEVTPKKLALLRNCDTILEQELRKEELYDSLWQAFPTLVSTAKTVGVMGDERSYQYPVVLRCVESVDAMTANAATLDIDLLKRIASRIVNEVDEVNRVFYDLTSKPPATIEFE